MLLGTRGPDEDRWSAHISYRPITVTISLWVNCNAYLEHLTATVSYYTDSVKENTEEVLNRLQT
jgi:hypothetical protein